MARGVWRAIRADSVQASSPGCRAGADAAWVDQVTFQPGETKPIITKQPADLVVPLGANATFQVAAVGTPILRYQWFFNGIVSILNGTNASLTLTNLQMSYPGSSFHVVITNRLGSTTSTTAYLTVLEPFLFSGAQLSNGWFWCTVSGTPSDGPCVIEASSNLVDWVPVANHVLSNSPAPFVDWSATNYLQRFYRARVE